MKYLRLLLVPFSGILWCIVALRNMFFDKGILPVERFTVPVISVGNISAGGTGKTPVVELLVRLLQQHGTIAVVSRGYKRRSRGTVVVSDGHSVRASVSDAGDEPYQIAQKFPSTIVVVDSNRKRAITQAVELGASCVLLDDAFQHRSVARDVDIVVLPLEDVFSHDFLLPAGNRREPLCALRRCDYIVLTRWSDESQYREALEKLRLYDKPCIGLTTIVEGCANVITWEKCALERIAGKRVIVVSGIGNPKSFESTVRSLNVQVTDFIQYPDHHWYTEADVEQIMLRGKRKNAEIVLTSEKDAVRIKPVLERRMNELPILFLTIQQVVRAGYEELEQLLSTIRQKIR